MSSTERILASQLYSDTKCFFLEGAGTESSDYFCAVFGVEGVEARILSNLSHYGQDPNASLMKSILDISNTSVEGVALYTKGDGNDIAYSTIKTDSSELSGVSAAAGVLFALASGIQPSYSVGAREKEMTEHIKETGELDSLDSIKLPRDSIAGSAKTTIIPSEYQELKWLGIGFLQNRIPQILSKKVIVLEENVPLVAYLEKATKNLLLFRSPSDYDCKSKFSKDLHESDPASRNTNKLNETKGVFWALNKVLAKKNMVPEIYLDASVGEYLDNLPFKAVIYEPKNVFIDIGGEIIEGTPESAIPFSYAFGRKTRARVHAGFLVCDFDGPCDSLEA